MLLLKEAGYLKVYRKVQSKLPVTGAGWCVPMSSIPLSHNFAVQNNPDQLGQSLYIQSFSL